MTITSTVREMVRRATEDLGGNATNSEIREAILARDPEINPSTIYAQINVCTVNSPSRVHYPENFKPRIANDRRYDLLYRVERGRVELYDPAKHGIWEIVKDTDGHLHVAMSSEGPVEAEILADEATGTDAAEAVETHYLFGFERHLREFLAANIQSLEVTSAPLSLFVDHFGQSGVEYPTGVGPIDILAIDANGDFVIFELKLGRGPDAAVGQIARYMGWVKHNLAGTHSVRGIIVARTLDERLRYAASVIPDVSLYEYSVSFTLQAVDEVGTERG